MNGGVQPPTPTIPISNPGYVAYITLYCVFQLLARSAAKLYATLTVSRRVRVCVCVGNVYAKYLRSDLGVLVLQSIDR